MTPRYLFLATASCLGVACTNIKAAGPDSSHEPGEEDEFDLDSQSPGSGGGGGDGGSGDSNDDTGTPGDDTGHADTGEPDTDTGEPDTSDPADPGVPLDGFGDITGDCGVVDLADASPQLWTNALDLGATVLDESTFDASVLTPGGQTILAEGSLGGSSSFSEAFAYEVLARCERAELLKTETEITYDDADSKKTDILIRLGSDKVGVSVTRGYTWPDGTMSASEAETLLTDKLTDIPSSAEAATDEDAWSRSMLHILAFDETSVSEINSAYATLSDTLVADTIVMVTRTDGEDGLVYDY